MMGGASPAPSTSRGDERSVDRGYKKPHVLHPHQERAEARAAVGRLSCTVHGEQRSLRFFEQTPAEAMLLLRGLPPETKPKDVRLNATSKAVSLSVGGEAVLTNAKLHLPCDPDESDFTLHDVGDTRTLAVSLAKLRLPGAPPSWPALLETAEML